MLCRICGRERDGAGVVYISKKDKRKENRFKGYKTKYFVISEEQQTNKSGEILS